MTWLEIVGYGTLIYLFCYQSHIAILTLVAVVNLVQNRIKLRFGPSVRLYRSALTPAITLIAPAYNEAATIVESVTGLTLLQYPEVEVLVVNDGSKDETLAVLRTAFDLEVIPREPLRDLPHAEVRAVYRSRRIPNLTVIDKANGGKADALNAGISFARHPLFCAIDADSVLAADALEQIVQPYLAAPEETVAVGGFVRIANGSSVHAGRVGATALPRNPLALFQIVEYLRAFYLGRLGWSAGNALLIISGAFGLFHTESVAAVGGYLTGSVGEDMELIVRLHRQLHGRRYRITFIPEPICWTEAPESLKVLGRQRSRWQRGLADTLWRHRSMFGNKRYRLVGLLAIPCFWLFELLGPLLELAGYLVIPVAALLGFLNWSIFSHLLVLSILLGALVSACAVLAEEFATERIRSSGQVLTLLAVALLENLGYRQLTLYWRIQGLWQYLRGNQSWGEMTRRGFTKA